MGGLFPGAGGSGNGELLFNGYRVSGLQDEISYGDAWWWWMQNSVNVFNTTKLST